MKKENNFDRTIIGRYFAISFQFVNGIEKSNRNKKEKTKEIATKRVSTNTKAILFI